ncbi:MAG: hypothetical protein ACPGJS_08250, partial [Flammeovirgaceae bacterium]
MRTYYIIMTFCLVHVFAWGQLETVFEENFDDNRNGWFLDSKYGYSTQIADGKLHMIQSGTPYTRNFTRNIFIDPGKDFVIGTKIKILKDDRGLNNGILWGYHGDSFYFFSITNKGKFQITYLNKDGTRGYLKEPTTSPHIQTGVAYNNIAVAKKGDKLYFFVNGQIIHEMLPVRFYGQLHGLVLASNEVEVDNFIVKTPNPKINLVDHPINGLEKENLGPNINSYAGEISPKISNDGTLLFVCRGNHRSNLGAKLNPNGRGDQDAWYAEKVGEEEWGAIKNMGRPINDVRQNAIASVSADNNTLLINYDGREDPGLMISNRTATGWETPKRVNIKDFYNRNEDAEFTLGPTGKVLIFSVERDDTYGEKDLYVSFRNTDGSWTKPKNLGNTINSFSTDFGPYLAADNTTLYFGSMGHPGYGSSDIFVSKRLDNTWTNWSVPKNLGPEINSKNWDAYYTITASGEEAYLATSGSYGNTDIFRVKLKELIDEESLPDPVVLIKGRV